MRIKIYNQKQGFTLIEIIISIIMASAIMGMLIFMITSSMDLRKKAVRLNTAIFLSEKLMDEIKYTDDLVDKTGEFENNPGFSYSYSMNEIEYDPFSGISSSIKDKEQAILEQHRASQSTELSTGLTFKMRKYNVVLFFQSKEIYTLECLRGLKIEQTAK
ncbi:MAG: prepilin-type N-terminal cleavage/methylation domain-containing protein [Spirochaetia bacterium]|nr:prepilin-type N-terminal cleavage/methylation domain-containing protein [Spirochaetia bacterium]